ncbi:MAG: hypothetical protein QOJ13_3341 [Gaiellales bacterium]|jgi:DNA-binding GntR family transcriptional regulator|nr:hypothetical protein [Gaiellales bacterium]MDX6594145.1 hypothetical protein [Gaiellales bacterium]
MLRKRILTGAIRPGSPLREVALARELGISRNTFREAIQALVFDGLVRHAPNRGATVARLGVDDAHDIYTVRRTLELAALERAVASRPADLRPLGDALGELERAAADHDWERLVEADLCFHRRLVDVLGSARLSGFFRTVETQIRLAFSIVAYADREYEHPAPLIEEHRDLFDVILRGQLDVARPMLIEHLAKYERRLVAVLADHEGRQAAEASDAG